MKYNLDFLDRLIDRNIGSDNDTNALIREISKTAYSLASGEEIRQYIHNIQSYLHTHKSEPALTLQCDRVSFAIEQTFRKHLDYSLAASQKRANNTIHLIEPYIAIFNNQNIATDKKLLRSLTLLTKPQNHSLTLHECHYLEHFWQTYDHEFTDQNVPLPEEQLVHFLISQNFNTPSFYKYMINNIFGELREEDNPHMQQEIIFHHTQIINNLSGQTRPYYHVLDAIQLQMTKWLKIELKHAQKRLKHYNPSQLSLNESPKMEMALSVAQTALFLKTMHKSGIITNNSQAEILKAASRYMKTKKTDNISYGSLANKYYEVETATVDSLKKLMENFLKNLDTHQ